MKITSIIIRYISIFIIFLFSFQTFAQKPWFSPKYLPEKKSNISFYDLQKAFNKWSSENDISKFKGWKQYKRWEWFMEPRVYPNGKLPDPAINAVEYDKYLAAHLDKSDNSANWVGLGPDNIVPSYYPYNLYGLGRINCVAFHPSDSLTFFVGASNGGVWKTADGGLSWMPLTDKLPLMRISDIAVDPIDPDIIYIATGDINWVGMDAISLGRNTAFGAGIYKTSDGGKSWIPTGLSYKVDKDNNYSLISKILINPANTNEICAAGVNGIWRSSDAALNWVKTIDNVFIDMVQNPLKPSTLYAATLFNASYNLGDAAIMRSYDFGITWDSLKTEIPSKEVQRLKLAVAPSDSNYVYALGCGLEDGFYALYRSVDAGNNWEERSAFFSAPNILDWFDGTMQQYGQGTYDLTLAVDLKDKNKIYTGGVNMWASSDGGESWDILSFWMRLFGESIHADQHCSAFNPLSGTFYECSDGGISRTKKLITGSVFEIQKCEDSDCYQLPTLWKNITDGLAITEFYRLALNKNNSNMVMGGNQDNGTFLYNNGTWLNIYGGDGMEAMFDSKDPNVLYVTNYSGTLNKSVDGGISFKDNINQDIFNAGEQGQWVTPFFMHPDSSNVLYTGFKNVWKSVNGGENWFNLSNFYENERIYSMAIAPSNPKVIYIFRIPNSESGPVLPFLRTKDGGENWDDISSNLPLDKAMITSITVDNKNPDKVWICFSGYSEGNKVFRSLDGGKNWTNISFSLPNVAMNTIVFQNNSPGNGVYVGSDIGVFYINDNHNDWIQYNTNLPNVVINELEIQYKSQKLYAATFGRGIWKSDLYENSIGISENNPNDKLNVKISPNPSKGIFYLNFNDFKPGDVKLVVYGVNGIKIKEQQYRIGSNDMRKELDLTSYSPGLYLINIVNSQTSLFYQALKQ